MGVSTTTPASLVLGPGDLSIGGTAVGATKDNATFKLTRRSYSPEMNKKSAPLKGARYIIEEIPSLSVTFSEFELQQLLNVLPNASIAGDGSATPEVLTSTIGRVADAEFENVEYVVTPGDGRSLTVRIKNALVDVDEDLEAEFGNEAEGAYTVTFVGHADPANPEEAPYEIERSL